jgi:hypothetical protein
MSNLIGVFLGGLLAIVGGSIIKWLEYSVERRSLRAAIKAEIAGLMNLIHRRGHGETFRRAITSWRADEEFEFYIFTLEEDFTPVYRANIGKVGLLGADVAGDVVKFYDTIISVRAELRAQINGETRRMSSLARADHLEMVLAVWTEAMELGADLTKRM